jgi:hypothetical protein
MTSSTAVLRCVFGIGQTPSFHWNVGVSREPSSSTAEAVGELWISFLKIKEAKNLAGRGHYRLIYEKENEEIGLMTQRVISYISLWEEDLTYIPSTVEGFEGHFPHNRPLPRYHNLLSENVPFLYTRCDRDS